MVINDWKLAYRYISHIAKKKKKKKTNLTVHPHVS